MKEFSYIITAPEGIHSRPSVELVREAAKYPCSVTLAKNNKTADAKRIFAVMGLCVKQGECLTVRVDGENEDFAAACLENFLKSHF